jgi:hypothetical protein
MTKVRAQDIRLLAIRLDVSETKIKDCIIAFWPTAYQPTKWEQKREQTVATGGR